MLVVAAGLAWASCGTTGNGSPFNILGGTATTATNSENHLQGGNFTLTLCTDFYSILQHYAN